MIRLTASLIALSLFSTTAAAQGIDVNSAASIGSNAFAETVRTYPAGRHDNAKAVLAQLDRLCASKRSADQARCEKAWQTINRAYAELQAKRGATN